MCHPDPGAPAGWSASKWHTAGFATLLGGLLACASPRTAPSDAAPRTAPSWAIGWPAPSSTDVPGAACLDVGRRRACWLPPDTPTPASSSCDRGVCLVPRPLPASADAPRPPLGWRCEGQGATRRCRPRGFDAPPFACNRAGCRRPLRVPDAADWACMERHGVLWCRAIGGAAGVPEGTSMPANGWGCGVRLGHPKERVCLDLSPDLPPPRVGSSWDCDVGHEPGPVRRCVPVPRQKAPARLGAACATQSDCPPRAVCVAGRCLPPLPPLPPECWEEADCGPSRTCAWGRCIEERAR